MSNPLPANFQPAFKRVAQNTDFDCGFACIAMLANKTLSDVHQSAIANYGLPKHGPYWIGEHLVASLLAHYGLVATIYKEFTGTLPDVAIVMVDYNTTTEIGRHVLFHRGKVEDAKKQMITVEYIIDPAYWISSQQHVRADWKELQPAWYIGVTPMKNPTKQASTP